MKKFEFFGASRATRQRHFKTSSTGDENGFDRKKTDLPLGCKTDVFLPSAYNIATPHEAKYTEGRGISTLTPLYVISTR